MTVFERIKESAKKLGWNIQTVAQKSGMGANSIYKWKTQTPNLEKLTQVSKTLGVSVDYLLNGTEGGYSSEPKETKETKKVNIEELLDGTAMLTDRDGELTDSDRAALRTLISTYLQTKEGRERLKKYSNMELDDNNGENGDD